MEQTFDLFDNLGASDEQLDFPIIYSSALQGYAGLDPNITEGDMQPLFEIITSQVAAPQVDPDGPFQMRITTLDYSSYVGVIGIGRVQRGVVKTNMPITVVDRFGKTRNGRVLQVLGFHGLERVEVAQAEAGNIIAVTGVDGLRISDTLCARDAVEQLPVLTVDEPTISMIFRVNDSPFAGKEGKYLTSRQIQERLLREASHNVALRIEQLDDPEKFRVSGRGELHLSILLETMRREGYEIAVSRPEVVVRETDAGRQEPYESLVVDLEESYQGAVMEKLGERKGELRDLRPDGKGRVRLDYIIPARGLIGFQNEFRTLSAGTGILHHVFDHWGPHQSGAIAQRNNGVLIANGTGKALAYALFNLQERGRLMVGHGADVYEGQVVGIHARNNDLTVNPLKAKQLTNVRAAGKDDSLILSPELRLTLEQALEFIDDDELVEITPKEIRVRKKLLLEHERKRASRKE